MKNKQESISGYICDNCGETEKLYVEGLLRWSQPLGMWVAADLMHLDDSSSFCRTCNTFGSVQPVE